MIKITVIVLGGLKEDYFKTASFEYEKRLSGYCKLNIIEINPCHLPEKPSESQINVALEAEAEKIIKNFPQGAYKIALCVEGTEHTSEKLAEKINLISVNKSSEIVFIIGSSYGLSEKIKKISDEKMSMSKMTFPHRLARIMLLEQIYRAFKINEGGRYHK